MKKLLSVTLSLCLLLSIFSACQTKETETTEGITVPSYSESQVTEATVEPATETTEDQTGHYQFNPKVCSPLIREIMGDAMCDTWFNVVDAVMAGEDSFECPDDKTCQWVLGQFPGICLPVVEGLIWYDTSVDPDHPVKNGRAKLVYNVPPEEVRQKIDEFGTMIEGILNENLRDDYNEFEICLALYSYFMNTYYYDYETYNDTENSHLDILTAMRVFNDHTGICCEFSTAYSYLLMQVGIDATTCSGHRGYDQASHEWSYVRLDGVCYHIDPTYALSDESGHWLKYFLMDDDKRIAEDDYLKDSFYYTCNYDQEKKHPELDAKDKRYEYLWEMEFISFDHKTHTIQAGTYDQDYNYTTCVLNY
ncbi:hypothetical protein SAMN02910456_00854 [Ruminococcaceae bacterium YRB3002]|nr:hypothetical protein SAMN02910456_00854 [Ruminococcaceae bacterium YRB3002]